MKIYQSQKENRRYLEQVQQIKCEGQVQIKTGDTKQELTGFGGAFTEATCYMLSCAKEADRTRVLNEYFGRESSNYSLARLTIHSCDFAMSNYEYVRDKNDLQLEKFDISNDHNYIIPIVKEALEINPDIKFLASPWSPPAYVKTTNMMNHGGKLKPEYYKTWALYFVKFIQEYEKQGIPIWAVTIQNEPSATQTWESCIWTAEEEALFVKDYLVPMFKAHNIDTKIIIHDHNRDDVNARVDAAFADPVVREAVYGIGIHWYVVEEYENLTELHNKYPEQHIMFTEGCCELGIGYETGQWKNGEKYSYEIINNFNNYCESFLDWNLVLDQLGGPNHVKNFCEAPVMIDYENDHQVTYNNSFYYIRHFSKFIEPGDVVISSDTSDDRLNVLVVKGEKHHKLFILNRSEEEINYQTDIEEFGTMIPPRAMQTIIL